MKFFLVLSFCICCGHMFGQGVKNNNQKVKSIIVLADGRNDSIIIRWAPNNLLVWQVGNIVGYKLERFTILKNGKANSEMQQSKITINEIKPYSKKGFDSVMLIDEKAAILKSTIYNEDLELISSKNAQNIDSIITNHNNLQLQMAYSLFIAESNPVIAKAAGLMYIDKNINKNERYLYKISVNKDSRLSEVKPGLVNISSKDRLKLHVPSIAAIQWGNTVATIIWETKLDRGVYSSYRIERSDDGKRFKDISDVPIINLSENPNNTKFTYNDSLQNNSTMYYYRLRGVSVFGENGPYSEVKSGRGTDQFNLLPVIYYGFGDLTKRKATIKWNFPDERKKELKGFIVQKAKQANGPYTDLNTVLLKKTDSVYEDKEPYESNYYKIKAIGNKDEEASSFPHYVAVADITPPLPPTGLVGKVFDSGTVIIKWKQNVETDLYGYRVYKGNALDEEFVEVSRDFIKQNMFQDTVDVQTLTKSVYYKIVAVDNNFNTSQYSKILYLKRPDKIAPSKPLFTEVKMYNGGIRISWVKSISDDVEAYTLKRFDASTKDSKIIFTKKNNSLIDSTYFDTTVQLGKIYYYELMVFDDSKNSSFIVSGEIEYETGRRNKIAVFKNKIDFKNRTITLNWKCEEKNIVKYILYRCKKGSPMELYKTFEDNEMTTTWVEKNLPIGNVYQYQIKAELANGAKTVISDIMEVKY